MPSPRAGRVTRPSRMFAPPRSLLAVVVVLVLTACNAGDSATAGIAASGEAPQEVTSSDDGAAQPVLAQAVADAVADLPDEINCAEPRPRADDFGWVCSGRHGALEVTVHLFAESVQGELFGLSIYAAAPFDADVDNVTDATEEFILDVLGVALPAAYRGPVADWMAERMPDGGRTLDVPDAGVTAALQPLAQNQWYAEVYELAPTS